MGMQIIMRSIPHDQHRYETVGDYYEAGDCIAILTSAMPDPRWEQLVLLHEFVEFMLCRQRGIPEPDIKAFDEMFEAERTAGKWTDEEPGNDPRSPYRKEHQFAEKLERLFADELGVDWAAYEAHCASL
jgi:hypothetical protein